MNMHDRIRIHICILIIIMFIHSANDRQVLRELPNQFVNAGPLWMLRSRLFQSGCSILDESAPDAPFWMASLRMVHSGCSILDDVTPDAPFPMIPFPMPCS